MTDTTTETSTLARLVYDRLDEVHAQFREESGCPLTLTEKILCSHLADPHGTLPKREVQDAAFRPDRVAMQDATAQMALLQFALTGKEKTAVPATIHCDHLIRARSGAKEDLEHAKIDHDEVYRFLRSAAARYGMGFWEPGAGIIHQVVLENYAFPGGMMLGTDSHTPNAGGLGMIAIGVGGADAMEVMAGLPFTVRWPKIIGVRLTGELNGWSAPKDVILKVCETLTVNGGTGAIVEYFGPGTETISATGKGTICNMGAEHGATCSLFPFDEAMARYLEATGREEIADLARQHASYLASDPEVGADPEDFYDQIIDIDLSSLSPMVVGPHSPDRARRLVDLGDEAHAENWPEEFSAALIGSCTNSSYEDMDRAASVAQQAAARGLKAKTPLYVTPGSDAVDQTIRRDGQMDALESIGATVLANACGPCIGQWDRQGEKSKDTNAIVTSFNRNFSGRNDGNHSTLAFIASPEIVVALSIAGRLDFDPSRDPLLDEGGNQVMLKPPVGKELPEQSFLFSGKGFVSPPEDSTTVAIDIGKDSERLQKLTPFQPIAPDALADLVILAKIKGKCTTDHISPAGPWLRYRGHLEKISDNAFTGAANLFSKALGTGNHVLTGEAEIPLPELAKDYRAQGVGWVVVGDTNYGEGSSREHAAMSPRFLGCRAVLVRSFARIAEANLKKQGILPLTFSDAGSWDSLQAEDRLTINGVDHLSPSMPLTVTACHADGSEESFECQHTLSELEIEWFRAGSALNYLRDQDQSQATAS